jgi:hypothetical protein
MNKRCNITFWWRPKIRCMFIHLLIVLILFVATPLWGKCEETHTPKSGNLKSSKIPENSKLDCKGQNTLHWGVLYTVGKVLNCRCPCSTSYGRKKGQESNWQFDSGPLKVRNRPDPSVCRWSATHCWKALEESYKFSSDLIPIGGLSWELWAPKVLGVQIGILSRLLLGSPGTKGHSDVSLVGKRREYYMGEGDGFPGVQAVMSQVSPCCPWLVPTARLIQNVD